MGKRCRFIKLGCILMKYQMTIAVQRKVTSVGVLSVQCNSVWFVTQPFTSTAEKSIREAFAFFHKPLRHLCHVQEGHETSIMEALVSDTRTCGSFKLARTFAEVYISTVNTEATNSFEGHRKSDFITEFA